MVASVDDGGDDSGGRGIRLAQLQNLAKKTREERRVTRMGRGKREELTADPADVH